MPHINFLSFFSHILLEPHGGAATKFSFLFCVIAVIMFVSIAICQWIYFGVAFQQVHVENDLEYFQQLSIHSSTVFFYIGLLLCLYFPILPKYSSVLPFNHHNGVDARWNV